MAGLDWFVCDCGNCQFAADFGTLWGWYNIAFWLPPGCFRVVWFVVGGWDLATVFWDWWAGGVVVGFWVGEFGGNLIFGWWGYNSPSGLSSVWLRCFLLGVDLVGLGGWVLCISWIWWFFVC